MNNQLFRPNSTHIKCSPLRAACVSLIGLVTGIVFLSGQSVHAQTEWLETLDESLSLESPNGWFQADLSGLMDLEIYSIDQRPPGLVFDAADALFSPRLSMFLDTGFGEHLYSFAQLRIDRGLKHFMKHAVRG